jgi:hypothetical protein
MTPDPKLWRGIVYGLLFTAIGVGLAFACSESVKAQVAPVPLGTFKRPAYEPPPETDWRPTIRLLPSPDSSLLGGPPARMVYRPLPKGVVACSLGPGGQEVCGPGVWLMEEPR